MPCSDGGCDNNHVTELGQRLDKVTRLLCGLCKVINEAGKVGINEAVFEWMPELDAWWKNHQTEDRIRLEREREERKEKQDTERALAKLSPRERRLLGIKKKFQQ